MTTIINYLIYIAVTIQCTCSEIPIVLNTWSFSSAAEQAWEDLVNFDITAVDAVVTAASVCELIQCDNTVGFGGSPDENGETTLDAMVFDGKLMDMGAVAGLRRVKNAVQVARMVLDYTRHSLLVGDLATEFAKKFNFTEESLSTEYSTNVWNTWKENNCQPNFWQNVLPDPKTQCGPYDPQINSNGIWYMDKNSMSSFNSQNHDTIGVIAIDRAGNVAAGTSSNGANHKIPGRVGDSPLPGAGAYADNEIGAAVATGDGDVMMRFLPSFLAVEELRKGSSPTQAAQVAINRIVRKYPNFMGAVLVCNINGQFGAACNGFDAFPFMVANEKLGGATVQTVKCNTSKSSRIVLDNNLLFWLFFLTLYGKKYILRENENH